MPADTPAAPGAVVRRRHAAGGTARAAGVVVLLALLALSVLPPKPVATALEPITAPDTVRLVGDDDVLIEVDGTRYHGTIELRPDGQVVNELPLERYLEGVAEMPSRWPAAALEAQAVAARTYAWWSARNGAHAGYDICASTACQVYRGAEVVLDGGQRWADAVAATAGQVLRDSDGDPILARYFSTSGGRTYANEEVFPATGARPYLVAIDDPFDAASPYHRWEVRFDRADLDALLAEGERLAAVVPVAEVERTGAVDDLDAVLRFRGEDGTEVEVSPLAVRDFLNQLAPARFPDRYPSRRADGLRPLPTTVPSTRFTVDVSGDEVVL
ncbi:MAG: SpoIID/LytB domain-containing protein, partial [Nitriliruptoraceae bacterium]